ncbi:hypothetical protein [Streptomyces mirabilis]|uniref:hypothetical protein n=1 Tax=Streptomyces mirabilis TaxID=68239 RepID=UPI0036D783DF
MASLGPDCGRGFLGAPGALIVEVADIAGGLDGDLLQLAGAQHLAGGTGECFAGGAQGAVGDLVHHRPLQRCGVQAGGQGQHGVGGVQVRGLRGAVGDAGDFHRAHGGQELAGVPGLGSPAGHLVGAPPHGAAFLPAGGGVQVVLHRDALELASGPGEVVLEPLLGACGHVCVTQTGDHRLELGA